MTCSRSGGSTRPIASQRLATALGLSRIGAQFSLEPA